MNERIVRQKEAAQRLGVHRNTLRRWIRIGRFPKPIMIGPRVVGWLEQEFNGVLKALHINHEEKEK